MKTKGVKRNHSATAGGDWDFYPLPSKGSDVQASLIITYYDEDGNITATQKFDQYIRLSYKDGCFSGRAFVRQHPATYLPLDNHDHGIMFTVRFTNGHPAVSAQALLQAYTPPRHFKDKIILGDWMHIVMEDATKPRDVDMRVKVLTMGRAKGHVIQEVQIEIPEDTLMEMMQWFEK